MDCARHRQGARFLTVCERIRPGSLRMLADRQGGTVGHHLRHVATVGVVGIVLIMRRRGKRPAGDVFSPNTATVERGAALDPLDREKLIARSLEVSGSGYLTVTSIIQGVTLGLLAQRVYTQLSSGSDTILVSVQAFATIFILMVIFYFYAARSILQRWALSFRDAVLPFTFGSFEVPPALLIGKAFAWAVSFGALGFVAILGLVFTRLWTPADHFGNKRGAHTTFMRMVSETQLIIFVMATTVIICALLARAYPHDNNSWGVVAACVSIIGMTVMVINMERRLVRIYSQYHIRRSLFN